ncbi:MAG: phosphatidylglycerol lysyltransferase domain-containing protein [Nitrospiraceae bacterium]
MPLLQLVPSRVCLQCDVCCRFPERDSLLRPYFTAEEIRRAIARGVDPSHFSDPNGCQVSVVPNPAGDGYLCPAFDPQTSHCRIYEDRPLDCQIYPLAVMWSRDHRQVVLGWDAKCPFMRDSVPKEIRRYADRIFDLLEQDNLIETFAQHQRLVGRFQEDVVTLKPLPRLTARLAASSTETLLRPLTFADRDRFDRAVTSVDTPLAHYAFAPHLIWHDLFAYEWAEMGGRFCLFARYADGMFMPLPPLPEDVRRQTLDVRRGTGGPEPLTSNLECAKAAFEAAFALMRAHNHGSTVSRIENVPEEWKTALESWGYRVKPKDPDYLYRTADLVALSGDRYKSQRAACNRFEREQRHSFGPYQDSDRDACAQLCREWMVQKQATGEDAIAQQMLADSEAAHQEALTHTRELGLAGHVVLVDGRIRAYTFGYRRSPSVFCVLLEVADRTIPGLAPFIFREFCREAATGGAEFVNTMDDSGLPSLAHAKRTYHPIRLVPSYIVTEP